MPFPARPGDQAIDPVLVDKYLVRIGHRSSQWTVRARVRQCGVMEAWSVGVPQQIRIAPRGSGVTSAFKDQPRAFTKASTSRSVARSAHGKRVRPSGKTAN